MSFDEHDMGEYAPCQICERISYPLNPCEDSGYSRICLTCAAEHVKEMDCLDCAETLATLDAETRKLYENI